MRAIFLAIDQNTGGETRRMATPFLLPLVDRPFVQHVVERLIDAGVTEFDMVLDERTRSLAGFFGNGERWGTTFRYHQAQSGRYPIGCLRTLTGATSHEPILLATADALPEFEKEDLVNLAETRYPLFYSNRQSRTATYWSGWAMVDGSFLASLPMQVNMETLSNHLRQSGEICLNSRLLHAGTYADLLKAQQAVIQEKVSRRARVHPTATIVGPVYIGDNALIERGARIGPNVVVGADSVIGANTCIQNSLVCPRTYVGDGLEINHLILDGTELFHAALSASVTIQEPIFLSRLAG